MPDNDCILHITYNIHIQLTPQKLSAGGGRITPAPQAPACGQKTRRGIEGEEKTGRRQYREVLLPERSFLEKKERSSESSSSKVKVVRTSRKILLFIRKSSKKSVRVSISLSSS